MEVTKDINRITVVLVEKKRTNKWLLPLVWGNKYKKINVTHLI